MHFRLDYAEPHPIFAYCVKIVKDKSRIKQIYLFFMSNHTLFSIQSQIRGGRLFAYIKVEKPGSPFYSPQTVFAIFFIVAIFLASGAVSYGILWGFVFLIILLSRLPLMLVLKSIKPLWIIIVLTMVIHMFTGQGENVIFSWKFFKVTQEGLEMGLKMSMRLILLLLISSILTFTTSPIVLTDGIEALLRPFKRFGVPAHELAMMMTIALRFIPTLLEETDRIMKAQTARGADFSSGNLMQRAKNMLPLLIPLFISAFRRADDLAVAMEARCYRGGEGRSRMHELVYYGRDYAALATVFVLIGLMAFIRWGNALCVL